MLSLIIINPMKYILLLCLCIAISEIGNAQSANVPLNQDYYDILNRFEIQDGKFSQQIHSSVKPYQRIKIAGFLDSLDVNNFNERDKFNFEYLANDNWEYMNNASPMSRKPFLTHFYRAKSDFYHVQTENFDLHINPVLNLSVGSESDDEVTNYQNTRGIEIRGMIGNKIGFYSYIGENQAALPSYVREYIAKKEVIPGEGFWKAFKDNGVDYFTGRGYISFNAIKEINVQFGYDKLRIGRGYRSLLLSDYANSYVFFKLSTNVWRLNYTNLFTKMTAETYGSATGSLGTGRFPSKFMSLHHLSLNITDHLNVGLFEAVVFGTPDENGVQHYEVGYLNPIIFYRSMEHQNGSVDNALVGVDLNWIITKNYLLYGQLILDEFKLDQINTGWWANKYGMQVGLKNTNVLGIKNLDLQLENNWARPYTYGHSDIYTNYAHYNQPMAHPLGANFIEYIGILKYQPLKRLMLEAKYMDIHYGADHNGSNWGGDVMLSYVDWEQEYENKLGQGISTDISILGLRANYHLKHNLFLEVSQQIRTFDNELGVNNKHSLTNIGLRWNAPAKSFDF